MKEQDDILSMFGAEPEEKREEKREEPKPKPKSDFKTTSSVVGGEEATHGMTRSSSRGFGGCKGRDGQRCVTMNTRISSEA